MLLYWAPYLLCFSMCHFFPFLLFQKLIQNFYCSYLLAYPTSVYCVGLDIIHSPSILSEAISKTLTHIFNCTSSELRNIHSLFLSNMRTLECRISKHNLPNILILTFNIHKLDIFIFMTSNCIYITLFLCV
jgi:hypothetical protein